MWRVTLRGFGNAIIHYTKTHQTQPGLGTLKQLLGTTNCREIWLLVTMKLNEIWLLGTPKVRDIWLSGPPNGVIFPSRKNKNWIFCFFSSVNKCLFYIFPPIPMPTGLMVNILNIVTYNPLRKCLEILGSFSSYILQDLENSCCCKFWLCSVSERDNI